ncbi:hypothetical protein NDU88_000641 [Pleurodeles waltl]|uniref:Uncharacterized protein n=1 Tax=Pleurodeles waltl TaxID=8319 RepID=A0AAV7WK99_PLEWA|nr:hypothetical protein NDU88_000641 [Pleurodeles waltl]
MSRWTAARPGHQHMLQTAGARAAAAQDESLDGSQATRTCYKRQQHGLNGAERQHKVGRLTAARPGHQHMLQTAAARAAWCGAAAQDEPLDGSQAWAPAHAANGSSTGCMVRSGSTR